MIFYSILLYPILTEWFSICEFNTQSIILSVWHVACRCRSPLTEEDYEVPAEIKLSFAVLKILPMPNKGRWLVMMQWFFLKGSKKWGEGRRYISCASRSSQFWGLDGLGDEPVFVLEQSRWKWCCSGLKCWHPKNHSPPKKRTVAPWRRLIQPVPFVLGGQVTSFWSYVCCDCYRGLAGDLGGAVCTTAKYCVLYYYHIYIPRTQLISIFEGQPSKTRPFPTKTRVIWVLGICRSLHS